MEFAVPTGAGKLLSFKPIGFSMDADDCHFLPAPEKVRLSHNHQAQLIASDVGSTHLRGMELILTKIPPEHRGGDFKPPSLTPRDLAFDP